MSRTYRDILREVYESKKKRNPSYSLVAYSRDAGFKSYHMSDILASRYNLSIKRAHDVAKNLKFNDILSAEFINLVIIEHSKNPEHVKEARERLASTHEKPIHLINDDDFSPLSEWYYMALIELFRNKDNYNLSIPQISDRLSIPEEIIVKAIEQLCSSQILQKTEDGLGLITKMDFVAVRTSKVGSTVIRKYHKQILTKAFEAIDTFSTQNRYLQSFNVTMDDQDYQSLCNDVADFIKNRIAQIQQIEPKGSVHAISFQVFPLEKK